MFRFFSFLMSAMEWTDCCCHCCALSSCHFPDIVVVYDKKKKQLFSGILFSSCHHHQWDREIYRHCLVSIMMMSALHKQVITNWNFSKHKGLSSILVKKTHLISHKKRRADVSFVSILVIVKRVSVGGGGVNSMMPFGSESCFRDSGSCMALLRNVNCSPSSSLGSPSAFCAYIF